MARYGYKGFRKLKSSASHRRAMMRNLVSSLVKHERIETTVAKAKDAQRHAEKMITLGKRGELFHRRKALAYVREEHLVHKIFNELAVRYESRPGGYTRVIPTRRRYGDNAPMAYLELVDRTPTAGASCFEAAVMRREAVADWTKFAEYLEPTAGVVTRELENGIPTLLTTQPMESADIEEIMDIEEIDADESAPYQKE